MGSHLWGLGDTFSVCAVANRFALSSHIDTVIVDECISWIVPSIYFSIDFSFFIIALLMRSWRSSLGYVIVTTSHICLSPLVCLPAV